MATEDDADVPETGAIFTFGKSQFADNIPNKFWIREDKVIEVCCGDEHTSFVAGTGRVFTFGINEWGQLGVGHNKILKKPTKLKVLKTENVRHAACGRSHTLLSTESGKLYSFGANSEGQLGLGHTDDVSRPTQIEGINTQELSQLAAGADHSVVLTAGGLVYVWGSNSEGQLGTGDDQEAWQPVQLNIEDRVTCISCGYYHTALVTESGGLYTFGETEDGKLGLGHDPEEHRTPQRVEGIQGKVIYVACGGKHTAAVTDTGKLYTFGEGSNGQLGHGTMLLTCDKPTLLKFIKKSTRIIKASCGENHTAVITDKGQLLTFGDGRHGKLALGEENFANQFKPTAVDRFSNFIVENVSCGGCHMLVIAKPRSQGAESSSEDEVQSSDEEDLNIKTRLNGSVENSLDFNGTYSARNRRRVKLPDPGDTLNRTLPPLDSSLSISKLQPFGATLPAIGNHVENSESTLANKRRVKDESDESGVSVSEDSDDGDQTMKIKRSAEQETKSALPMPKPRPTPRKSDTLKAPLPSLRLQPLRPRGDGIESDDSKGGSDKKDQSKGESDSEHEEKTSKKDSDSEDELTKSKKLSKKDKNKPDKKKGMFGRRRKIVESDSEDEEEKHKDKDSSDDKTMERTSKSSPARRKGKLLKDKTIKKGLPQKHDRHSDKSDETDISEDEGRSTLSRKKVKQMKKKPMLKTRKESDDEGSHKSESAESDTEQISKQSKLMKRSPIRKRHKIEDEDSDSDENTEKILKKKVKEVKKKPQKKKKKNVKSDDESEKSDDDDDKSESDREKSKEKSKKMIRKKKPAKKVKSEDEESDEESEESDGKSNRKKGKNAKNMKKNGHKESDESEDDAKREKSDEEDKKKEPPKVEPKKKSRTCTVL